MYQHALYAIAEILLEDPVLLGRVGSLLLKTATGYITDGFTNRSTCDYEGVREEVYSCNGYMDSSVFYQMIKELTGTIRTDEAVLALCKKLEPVWPMEHDPLPFLSPEDCLGLACDSFLAYMSDKAMSGASPFLSVNASRNEEGRLVELNLSLTDHKNIIPSITLIADCTRNAGKVGLDLFFQYQPTDFIISLFGDGTVAKKGFEGEGLLSVGDTLMEWKVDHATYSKRERRMDAALELSTYLSGSDLTLSVNMDLRRKLGTKDFLVYIDDSSHAVLRIATSRTEEAGLPSITGESVDAVFGGDDGMQRFISSLDTAQVVSNLMDAGFDREYFYDLLSWFAPQAADLPAQDGEPLPSPPAGEYEKNYQLAVKLFDSHEYDLAIEACEKALQYKENDLAALFELSEAYIMLKDYAKAEETFLAMAPLLTESADKARLTRRLGFVQLAKTNYDLAEALFLASLDLAEDRGTREDLEFVKIITGREAQIGEDERNQILKENGMLFWP